MLEATTDAQKWAREFMHVADAGVPIDESLMIGWFANAIEAGRDAGEMGNEIGRGLKARVASNTFGTPVCIEPVDPHEEGFSVGIYAVHGVIVGVDLTTADGETSEYGLCPSGEENREFGPALTE